MCLSSNTHPLGCHLSPYLAAGWELSIAPALLLALNSYQSLSSDDFGPWVSSLFSVSVCLSLTHTHSSWRLYNAVDF